MNDKLINLEEFTTLLKSYRSTLEKMNALTEKEIERVSSIGLTMNAEKGLSGKEATIFINKQMYAYLEKLEELVNTIPEYTVHGCFTSDEIQNLQQRALSKLRDLGCA